MRSCWSSVFRRKSSTAPKPLASQSAASSPSRAFIAIRAETGNTCGASPRSVSPFWRTKPSTSSRSAAVARMSTLLTMKTIFFPQERICSRKPRSLSVNGRSAEVTKITRSERGT